MSDLVWILIAAAVIAVIIYLNLKSAERIKASVDRAAEQADARAREQALEVKKVAHEAKDIASKVEGVREALLLTQSATESKIEENTAITKGVYTLVNHKMHLALKSIAHLLGEKAEHSGLPEDRKKADEAHKELTEHDAKQHVVDEYRAADDDKSGTKKGHG
jgi:hypothetical protein